ncbi:MAG: DUF4271 domain-containing protein [Rikenellaceae bacterium]
MKDHIIELFGQDAEMHFTTYMEPLVRDEGGGVPSYLFEYGALTVVVAVVSLVLYKNSEVITRMLQMTYSFPMLVRQLDSINHSLDVAARSISSLLLLLLPMALLSHRKFFATNLFEESGMNEILMAIVIVLLLGIYLRFVKAIFYRFAKNRFFYRKLYFAERISLSSYTIISFPIILLSFVSIPYQNNLVVAQFLLIVSLYFHYLVTDLKLFIEEKVSYVQLILYFCTVKAVIIGFLIYFGVYVI